MFFNALLSLLILNSNFGEILFKDDFVIEELESLPSDGKAPADEAFLFKPSQSKDKSDEKDSKSENDEFFKLMRDELEDVAVSTLIEELTTAFIENDISEIARILGTLLVEYPDVEWEGTPLSLYVHGLLQKSDQAVKDEWNRLWKYEIDDFKQSGRVHNQMLLKLSQHDELIILFKRLIPILAEQGHYHDMAKNLILAQMLNLETEKLYGTYLNYLSQLKAGPHLLWALEGWQKDILKPSDYELLKEHFDKTNESQFNIPPDQSLDRPYRAHKWTIAFDQGSNLSQSKGQQEIKIKQFLHHVDDETAMSCGSYKILHSKSGRQDSHQHVYCVDVSDGSIQWTHTFKRPPGKVKAAYYSNEGSSYHLDVVQWSVPLPQSFNILERKHGYETHFVTHTSSGQKLWEARLKDFVQQADRTVLAGRPIQTERFFIVPTLNVSGVSFSDGGHAFLDLIAIDIHSGQLVWKQTASIFKYRFSTINDHVILREYQGSVIVSTGHQSVVSLDLVDGRILWQHAFLSWYDKAGIKILVRDDLMGGFVAGVKEDTVFKNSFFKMNGSFALIKEYDYGVVFLIDLNSGKPLDYIDFKELSPFFVSWSHHGALLLTDNGYTSVTGIQEKKMKMEHRDLELPRPINAVIPWGSNSLIHSREALYELNWSKVIDRGAQKCVDLKADERVSPFQDHLLIYDQSQLAELKKLPQAKKALEALWEKEKFPELAEILYNEYQSDWPSKQKLIETLDRELRKDKTITNLLHHELVSTLYASEFDRFHWLLNHLVSQKDVSDVVHFMKISVDGSTYSQDGETIEVSPGHHISADALYTLVHGVTRKSYDLQDPKSIKKNRKKYMLHGIKSAPKKLSYNKTLNQRWLIKDNSKSIFNILTFKSYKLKGHCLAANNSYIAVSQEEKKSIFIYDINDNVLGEIVSQIDVKPFRINLAQQKQQNHGWFSNYNQPQQQEIKVFCLIESRLLVQKDNNLFCFDVISGQLKWRREFDQIFNLRDSLEVGHFLYLLENDSNDTNLILSKIDLRTGFSLWQSKTKILMDNRILGGIKNYLVDFSDHLKLFTPHTWVSFDKKTGQSKTNHYNPPEKLNVVNQDVLSFDSHPKVYTWGDEQYLFKMNIGGINYHSYQWYTKDAKLVQSVTEKPTYATYLYDNLLVAYDEKLGEVQLVDLATKETIKSFSIELKERINWYGYQGLVSYGDHVFFSVMKFPDFVESIRKKAQRGEMLTDEEQQIRRQSFNHAYYDVYMLDVSTQELKQITLQDEVVKKAVIGENFISFEGDKKKRLYYFYQPILEQSLSE